MALVERDRGAIPCLVADGGPAASLLLMQLQADISGRRVESYTDTGLSALGAGHLAGAIAGMWKQADIPAREPVVYEPRVPGADRDEARRAWHQAVT